MRTEGEAHFCSTLALEGRREMDGEKSIFLAVLSFVFLVWDTCSEFHKAEGEAGGEGKSVSFSEDQSLPQYGDGNSACPVNLTVLVEVW